MGTAANVRVGVGKLYFAEVGATEPVDFTSAWSAAWIPVGYTDEGHSFTQTPSYDDVTVAEELIPIRSVKTALDMTLEFAAAEITAVNIQKAFNGGTITTGTGFVTFTPPAASAADTRVAIGWESDDNTERWVFRKCVQTGGSEITRRKGADKATIPMSFKLEVVDGSAPFKAMIKN